MCFAPTSKCVTFAFAASALLWIASAPLLFSACNKAHWMAVKDTGHFVSSSVLSFALMWPEVQ